MGTSLAQTSAATGAPVTVASADSATLVNAAPAKTPESSSNGASLTTRALGVVALSAMAVFALF